MRRIFVFSVLCLSIAASRPCGVRAADKPSSSTRETAAEKLRKALDRVGDLEIADAPLDAAVNQLREQTGMNIIIDQAAMPPALPGLNAVPGGIAPAVPSASYAHLRIQGQFHGEPVRKALTKLLRKHDLTHVLVGDTVLITTNEKANERQLRQPVSVNVENVALRDELKRLARTTGANVVLDPRMAKEGQTALTLRLDDVALETAVELLADEAGLRAVPLGNVLYVTSDARAEKLRKPASQAAFPNWHFYPDGQGGFRVGPPAPRGGGIGGIGGMGGIAGLAGGVGGIAGLGGGGFNQLGGLGRITPPVPLTPPLPKAEAKPAPKEKPTKEAPAVKPDNKAKPPAKEKPPAQATAPEKRSSLARRKRGAS